MCSCQWVILGILIHYEILMAFEIIAIFWCFRNYSHYIVSNHQCPSFRTSNNELAFTSFIIMIYSYVGSAHFFVTFFTSFRFFGALDSTCFAVRAPRSGNVLASVFFATVPNPALLMISSVYIALHIENNMRRIQPRLQRIYPQLINDHPPCSQWIYYLSRCRHHYFNDIVVFHSNWP